MLCFKETVNDGVGRTVPGHGVVSGCSSPPGWLRRADLGDGVNSFKNMCILLKINGDYWQDPGMAKGVPRSTVTGLE